MQPSTFATLALLLSVDAAAVTVCASGCDYTTIAAALAANQLTLDLGPGDHDGGALSVPGGVTVRGAGKNLTRVKCVANAHRWTGPNVVGYSQRFSDLTMEACQAPLFSFNSQNSLILTNVRFEVKAGPVWSGGGLGYSVNATGCDFVPWTGQSSITGNYLVSYGSMTVRNSTFVGGRGSSGGALSAGHSATIEGNTFIDNRSSGNGGVLRNFQNDAVSSTLLLRNNRFCANQGALGGVVYAEVRSSGHTVSGNVFIGNTGTTSGGAVYIKKYSGASTTPVIRVFQNTFLSNASPQGSAYALGTDLPTETYNNLFGWNTGGAVLWAVPLTQTQGTTVNAFWQNAASFAGGFTELGTQVTTDPDLVDPPPYTLSGPSWADCAAVVHFLPGSPLQGTGDRRAGTTPVDIGAMGVANVNDVDGDGVSIGDGDCNDRDPAIKPGAPELCNLKDDDCDGAVDDSAPGSLQGWRDADGDTYGKLGAADLFCGTVPSTHATRSGDCNDGNALIKPNAAETCDGVDQDCDGSVDEEATDRVRYYLDSDGDGHGSGTGTLACARPSGHSALGGDCAEGNPAIHPAAAEICNGGVDDDCKATTDEVALFGVTTWPDADGDGFGDGETNGTRTCPNAAARAENGEDCDDAVALVNPDADEVCNEGIDDDCDPSTDEDVLFDTGLYLDRDGDGHGDPDARVVGCPSGEVAVVADDDCDDADPEVHPDAPEVCNGIDDDCDPSTKEAEIDGETWYADADADGFGAGAAIRACARPSGAATKAGDCDDGAPSTHPGAPELCNGDVDDDCDPGTDEVELDGVLTWRDADGDGFGDERGGERTCPTAGRVERSGDCADDDGGVHPDADERCNGIDDDCDPSTPDGLSGPFYADLDLDGFGTGEPTMLCDAGLGAATKAGDCDDARWDVFPGATEQCDDVDQDCDGVIDEGHPLLTFYADLDGDGFGAGDAIQDCARPVDHVGLDGDCDDADAWNFPGNPEVCDGGDNDCDGQVDEPQATDARSWWVDADGDTFGVGGPERACEAPSPAHAPQDGDCDDGDAGRFPGAEEPDDGTDWDCDGLGSKWIVTGGGCDSVQRGGAPLGVLLALAAISALRRRVGEVRST